jgi:hypothetical protein
MYRPSKLGGSACRPRREVLVEGVVVLALVFLNLVAFLLLVLVVSR